MLLLKEISTSVANLSHVVNEQKVGLDDRSFLLFRPLHLKPSFYLLPKGQPYAEQLKPYKRDPCKRKERNKEGDKPKNYQGHARDYFYSLEGKTNHKFFCRKSSFPSSTAAMLIKPTKTTARSQGRGSATVSKIFCSRGKYMTSAVRTRPIPAPTTR